MDSRGNVYVGDWQTKTITVLSPSGEIVRMIGRSGAGPGEFGSVSGVEILDGDSVQAYDLQFTRLTVFLPGTNEVAYTVNMAAPGVSSFPFKLQRTRDAAGMLATYRRPFVAGSDPREDARRTDVLKLLGADGSLRQDSLLVFPAPMNIVLRSAGRVAVNSDPFDRKGVVQLGPDDRIYYTRTDSSRVRIYSLEGDSVGGFTVPHVAPPVTPEDIDREAGKMKREGFRRALEESAPEHWPAIRNMVVDDAGRVWVGLAAPYGEPVEWAAFTAEGRYLGSTRLPADAYLTRVRGDRLYAVATDELDVPRVVTYRLDRALGGSLARR